MTAPLASVDDLADVWRPLTDAEVPRAENLIAKASALLRQATLRTIDERIVLFATDPGDPRAVDPAAVATMVATVVKRFIDNIDGAVSKSETAGPYARQVSYALRGDTDIRGELAITAQDLAKLLSPGLTAQVGSITVGVSPVALAGMRGASCYSPESRLGDFLGRSW